MIEAAMNDLSGRRALITGGGTGIGFGCAQALLAAGAFVTIGGRRAEVLADAADQLDAGTGRVQTVTCDVTDEDQVRHAIEVAADGHNLDVLVANAGTGFPGAILDMPAEGWDFAFRLNIIGTALCIKHAGLRMKEHGGGSVVVVSSTAATKVQPWMAPYSVSKAALDMLVRCAAVELSPQRIRVNGVSPAMFQLRCSHHLPRTLSTTPLPAPRHWEGSALPLTSDTRSRSWLAMRQDG
jgi:NAD(P)-dependent dehydrogenase (short-subunit alcohol dehydrogenase family)